MKLLGLGAATNMVNEREGDVRGDYCLFDLNNWIDEGKGKQEFVN